MFKRGKNFYCLFTLSIQRLPTWFVAPGPTFTSAWHPWFPLKFMHLCSLSSLKIKSCFHSISFTRFTIHTTLIRTCKLIPRGIARETQISFRFCLLQCFWNLACCTSQYAVFYMTFHYLSTRNLILELVRLVQVRYIKQLKPAWFQKFGYLQICFVMHKLNKLLDEIIWAKYRDLLLARNQLFCVWTGLLIFGFFEVKNWNDNFLRFVHPAVTDFGFCWEGFYNYLLFVCESFADSSKQIDRPSYPIQWY